MKEELQKLFDRLHILQDERQSVTAHKVEMQCKLERIMEREKRTCDVIAEVRARIQSLLDEDDETPIREQEDRWAKDLSFDDLHKK